MTPCSAAAGRRRSASSTGPSPPPASSTSASRSTTGQPGRWCWPRGWRYPTASAIRCPRSPSAACTAASRAGRCWCRARTSTSCRSPVPVRGWSDRSRCRSKPSRRSRSRAVRGAVEVVPVRRAGPRGTAPATPGSPRLALVNHGRTATCRCGCGPSSWTNPPPGQPQQVVDVVDLVGLVAATVGTSFVDLSRRPPRRAGAAGPTAVGVRQGRLRPVTRWRR